MAEIPAEYGAERSDPNSLMAMNSQFTPLHRGGSSYPIVLVHGFIDTLRSWELILP